MNLQVKNPTGNRRDACTRMTADERNDKNYRIKFPTEIN